MQIQGTPSPAPRPDKGARPAVDVGTGSTFEAETGRVDAPGAALPATDRSSTRTTGNRGDSLEISGTARLLRSESNRGASAERIEELKQSMREGTLNNREAIELAARRILGARD
jgi:anti-sigma28 factor (negative regulator of flagellin synthesis)